jgi:ABC-type molybdenum transport system ATPase subunit/photorepair protein PhrA
MISPEMVDAFPRRHPGMSVWEAITTGFDGSFVPRTRDASPYARKFGGLEWVDVSDEEINLPASSMQLSGNGKRKEKIRQWRISRCWEVLQCLGPASWALANSSSQLTEITNGFATLPFTSLSPGEQRLVLLMRALVGRPPLILLDEAWSGMDDNMLAAVRRYLRGEVISTGSGGHVRTLQGIDATQAVVVVTHWEEEVPWKDDEIRVFDL